MGFYGRLVERFFPAAAGGGLGLFQGAIFEEVEEVGVLDAV